MRRSPHRLAEPSQRQMWLLLWPAAAVVGLTAEWRLYGWADPGDWALDLLTGWTMIACGLADWSRRPQNRSGALLTATGFAWFAPNYAVTGVTAIAWLSAHAPYLHRGPLVQLVLTYPTGRAARRLDRAAVIVGYAVAVITPVWADATATIVLACLLVAVASAVMSAPQGASAACGWPRFRRRRCSRPFLRQSRWFASRGEVPDGA